MSPAKRLYEPPIFEGRVMLPEVQEQIYEEIIQFERMEYVGPQMRELILDVWPELAHKLPPEDAESPRDEDQTRSPPLPLWHSNADLDPDAVFSLPIFGGSFGLCRSRSVATVARLQANGVALLSIPENYYDDLEARVGMPADRLKTLKANNILYDKDGDGEYLQIYTQSFKDLFFLEIVERCGYKGFGAVNASIRLNAQSRLARGVAESRI